MRENQSREDEFGKRIGDPLRAEERVDGTFETRVMSGVHAIARAERARADELSHRTWWVRPYTIRLTPLASLAAAAGVVAVLLTGTSIVRRPTARSQSLTSAASPGAVDTVHLVRFVLADPSARSVALVGSFNGWQKTATPLRRSAVNGVWTVSVPLSAGRQEYAFIVFDGTTERWIADPMNEAIHDDFSTESSVIQVGSDVTS